MAECYTHTPMHGSASFYFVFTVCVICRQLKQRKAASGTLTGWQHIHLPPNNNKGTGVIIPVPSLYQMVLGNYLKCLVCIMRRQLSFKKLISIQATAYFT